MKYLKVYILLQDIIFKTSGPKVIAYYVRGRLHNLRCYTSVVYLVMSMLA